jgi:tetratricopeptide (TPR) repeat protein
MVMDPVPRDPEKYKEFRRLLLVYTELLTSYFVVNRQVVNKDSDFDYDTYKYYLDLMEKNGRKEVLKMLEDKIFSYSDSDDECDYYCLRWGLRILMYERKNYGKPRYEDFEGFKVPVGCCAEGIFREAYGNTWMMIPEVQEQETHDSLHSLTLSYQNYISDYLNFMNKEEAFKNYWDYKKFRVDILIDNETNTVNRHKMFAVKHKMHIEKVMADRHINPVKLLEQKRYNELRTVLKEYYAKQLSGDFNKWQIFINVSDSIIYPAVMLLIIDGKYHQALKILKLCDLNGRMQGDIAHANDVANAVRDVSIAIYDHKNLDEAKEINDKWFGENPDVIDFIRCDLQTSLYLAKSEGEYESCLKKAEELCEVYPNDGEIIKLKGDALIALGRIEDGVEAYLEARKRTRNGIVLNFMRKRMLELGVDEEVVAKAPLL